MLILGLMSRAGPRDTKLDPAQSLPLRTHKLVKKESRDNDNNVWVSKAEHSAGRLGNPRALTRLGPNRKSPATEARNPQPASDQERPADRTREVGGQRQG